ncbi:MAG: hypothetical protein LCH66_10210 [Actinobacteria bacterium]|jgi:hypothetical protein|nr:hypothetical protein [Actinomycetota bacterium]
MAILRTLATAAVLALSTVTATSATAEPLDVAKPIGAMATSSTTTICYWVPRLPGCPRR